MMILNALKKIALWPILAGLSGLFALPSWAALPIVQWQHRSGAQVFWVHNTVLPILDLQIDVDGGSRRDPAGQIGLASASAAMFAKGVLAQGARPALDENGLSEAWADFAAAFQASASADRLSFQLRILTDSPAFEPAIDLVAQQLALPAWPDGVWQSERRRWQAAIKEANTRPATVAARAYAGAVYGGHPYGFETTAEQLDRISVADMRAFYESVVLPCRARISLVGPISRSQADALVDRLMQPLLARQSSCPALPAVPEVPALKQAVTLKVPFDSAQAHVLLGQPGFKRDDPDFFALLVGNYTLGSGGFVSRLYHEVREKRGLSYSVGSGFGPGLHAGAFTISLQTRPDQAAQALAVSREVLADYVKNGPTPAELQAAKDNLIGSFALRIDTNRKLLDNVANIATYGLPLNYLDTWTTQVARITADDVKAALARHLQPDRMVVVVLGAQP